MTIRELELKYLPHVKRVGVLTLIPASEAIRLLSDLSGVDAKILGVEAFRLFDDGGVQPAMEFSNISYGRVVRNGCNRTSAPVFGNLVKVERRNPGGFSDEIDVLQTPFIGRLRNLDSSRSAC